MEFLDNNWYGTRDSNPQHPKAPGPKPGVSSHSTNPALLVSCGGIEPPTLCLKGKYSTAELTGLIYCSSTLSIIIIQHKQSKEAD
ncbi:27842_t:CDS:1 [Gigaspora margarita]|uniref:27842_t:CDS:1 n=1 Tax=Gigaspora margarita TaxID=4874 RepID=A0ABN7UHB5_GIGMA|nr:27842_t:CDS:1 [Gigaspora margarita]